MLANFNKEEFHQFIMMYLEESIGNRWELVREDNESWYDFLEQLDIKNLMSILSRNKPKYSAKVRSMGKQMVYIISESDEKDKVQVLT